MAATFIPGNNHNLVSSLHAPTWLSSKVNDCLYTRFQVQMYFIEETAPCHKSNVLGSRRIPSSGKEHVDAWWKGILCVPNTDDNLPFFFLTIVTRQPLLHPIHHWICSRLDLATSVEAVTTQARFSQSATIHAHTNLVNSADFPPFSSYTHGLLAK